MFLTNSEEVSDGTALQCLFTAAIAVCTAAILRRRSLRFSTNVAPVTSWIHLLLRVSENEVLGRFIGPERQEVTGCDDDDHRNGLIGTFIYCCYCYYYYHYYYCYYYQYYYHY